MLEVVQDMLAGFHFMRPQYLWLMLLPLLIYTGLWYFRVDRLVRWSIAEHLLAPLLVDQDSLRRWNPLTVSLLLSVIAVLIVAGPSWRKQDSPFVQNTSDLVVVLALTESMGQADVQPSRYERARQKVRDLLDARDGGRSALIAYAGTAHQVVPLTGDTDIVWNFLLALEPGVMPERGARPSAALPLLTDLRRQSAEDANRSVSVLLIADDLPSEEVPALRSYFTAEGAPQLVVYGVGTLSGGEADDSHRPLNEPLLRQFARDVGGDYQRLSTPADDVKRLDRLIDRHLQAAADTDDRPWRDDGYFLLFPMALLMLLWFRRGWTLQWCLLLALVAAQPVPARASEELTSARMDRFLGVWLTPDQKGQYYFKRGQYAQAAQSYRDPFRRGVALYYSGQYREAGKVFGAVYESDPNEQALYYQANAQAQERAYVAARASYAMLIEAYPDGDYMQRARHNHAIVDKIIKEADAFTEAQAEEQGVGQDLGDAPQSSEGADRQMGEAEAMASQPGQDDEPPTEGSLTAGGGRQLTADEILGDAALQETWMKQVTQDPSAFLGAKFQIQAGRRVEGASP